MLLPVSLLQFGRQTVGQPTVVKAIKNGHQIVYNGSQVIRLGQKKKMKSLSKERASASVGNKKKKKIKVRRIEWDEEANLKSRRRIDGRTSGLEREETTGQRKGGRDCSRTESEFEPETGHQDQSEIDVKVAHLEDIEMKKLSIDICKPKVYCGTCSATTVRVERFIFSQNYEIRSSFSQKSEISQNQSINQSINQLTNTLQNFDKNVQSNDYNFN